MRSVERRYRCSAPPRRRGHSPPGSLAPGARASRLRGRAPRARAARAAPAARPPRRGPRRARDPAPRRLRSRANLPRSRGARPAGERHSRIAARAARPLLLRVEDELSYADMAALLFDSEESLRKRVQMARQILRRAALAGEAITVETPAPSTRHERGLRSIDLFLADADERRPVLDEGLPGDAAQTRAEAPKDPRRQPLAAHRRRSQRSRAPGMGDRSRPRAGRATGCSRPSSRSSRCAKASRARPRACIASRTEMEVKQSADFGGDVYWSEEVAEEEQAPLPDDARRSPSHLGGAPARARQRRARGAHPLRRRHGRHGSRRLCRLCRKGRSLRAGRHARDLAGPALLRARPTARRPRSRAERGSSTRASPHPRRRTRRASSPPPRCARSPPTAWTICSLEGGGARPFGAALGEPRPRARPGVAGSARKSTWRRQGALRDRSRGDPRRRAAAGQSVLAGRDVVLSLPASARARRRRASITRGCRSSRRMTRSAAVSRRAPQPPRARPAPLRRGPAAGRAGQRGGAARGDRPRRPGVDLWLLGYAAICRRARDPVSIARSRCSFVAAARASRWKR